MRMSKDYGRIVAYYFSEGDSDTMGPALDSSTFTYGTDHSVVVVLKDPETGKEYTCLSPYEPGSDGWKHDIDFLTDWQRFADKPIGKYEVVSVKHYPQDFAELAGKTVEGVLTKEELGRKSSKLEQATDFVLNQDFLDLDMDLSKQNLPEYQKQDMIKKSYERSKDDPYVTYFYTKDTNGPKNIIKMTHKDPKLAMDGSKVEHMAKQLGISTRNLSSMTGQNPTRKK